MASVSVIIPVYNGEASVARAIDSVLAQDFPPAEIIVIDDGSTDATGVVLSKYAGKIRVSHQNNSGTAAARNKAAALASGEYLAFLDADDWWRKDKLRLAVEALETHGTAILAFSGYREILPDGTPLADYSYKKAPSFDDMFTHRIDIFPSSVLIRRSAFERCGGFCEEFRTSGFEDTYFWIVARELGEFKYLDQALVSRQLRSNYCQDYWFVNARKFKRLILARYGRRARPIIRQNDRDLASMALEEMARQLRLKNMAGAFHWWVQATRARPLEACGQALARVPRAGARLYRRSDASRLS